jgi:hypothetical protein
VIVTVLPGFRANDSPDETLQLMSLKPGGGATFVDEKLLLPLARHTGTPFKST